MAEELTLGLIGCGGMMEGHAKGLGMLWEKGFKPFRVIATCDVVRSRAEELANKIAEWQGSKPSVYESIDSMLAAEKQLDAVDISLVHKLHHTAAVQCLEAGKHVTIEKPLAMTLRAGRLIMESAEKNKRVLQVAENYRRAPAERAINWAIRNGQIGKIRMLFWVDIDERRWGWGWRDDINEAGGGWSMDGGVHFADLFRYHIGEVEEVYCVSRAYDRRRWADTKTGEGFFEASIEDSTFGVLKFENGVTGQWTSTLAAPEEHINYRAIYGEEGCIRWGVGLKTRSESLSIEALTDKFMKALPDDEKEKLFPFGITDTVATELKEFIDAVIHGMPIEITGIEGYKDEAICLALYESSEIGSPVKMADVESLKIENYQARFNKMLGIG